MDIVDTLNHLIPSDQLDDSLQIGQNLECEASNEFGSVVQLEDSLKNMLSDKDPMLGSAQFNLLDNEDSSFQIAGPTGLEVAATEPGLGVASGELKSTETAVVKRPVGRPRKQPRHLESETDGQGPTKRPPTGRPGRKPVNRLKKSFLIEKGVTGAQLKKELNDGGRINIDDFSAGLWINPVVVLKRLTVTVGGFRIELLPGPSYAANAADAAQSVCFEDTFSYCGDIQYAMLQDDAVDAQAPENQTNLGGIESISTEDVPLGLGPYVNPNEVQAANGGLVRSPRAVETKLDNQSGPAKHKPVSAEKDAVKQPQNAHGNNTEKVKTLGPKQLKSKPGPAPLKSKNSSPSSTMKGPKSPQNKPSKITHTPGVNRGKTLNEKKDVSLKRHGEDVQDEHAPKVQKMQDKHANKVKPKSPGPSKKSPSSDSGPAEPQGPTKNSHVGPKPESSPPAHGATGHSSRSMEDSGQDAKSKLKKLEKFLQRQKSKTVRSLSVDEPQLFIPDNAPPVVKKEPVEEQTTGSDTLWDGNHCGLCKKHHNNTFMVGCGRCDDWFHGDCVGLDLTKVREMEEEDQMYVCLKCCAEEPDTQSTVKPEAPAKPDLPDSKPPPRQQGPPHLPTSPGARPLKKESERKHSTEVKDTSQKTVHPKLEMKRRHSSPGVKKPVSVDEIRRSVRDSLKEILLQRLKDSDLRIMSEKASEVAKKTERELFHLYKDTDSKYKNKYRSLMFNLKDTKNNVLFKRVLKGEISPAQLIRMSPEELASKELAAWRKRENRHTIEMIEKQEREVERRPITKITHKGEIEIESQEPAKTTETLEVEPEPAPKVTEPLLDLLPLETTESTKTTKDTTAQHKSHLFDLHCKICTGRMAPPVEEAPTKVVATTVVRRQSAPSEEHKSTTPPVKDEDLHLTVLEESFLKATSFASEGRSEFTSGRAEETAFLSNLKKLWRGFINMPAVAKLVTKVFPVSGIFDNLTEDLPDSIQVGGRISPQIVWDYLEKIRATGTKEVCLIRFSPETEEDEISYTLLFAYFSSRKRFGVVANNLKKVKDMYIVPLGATEKIPHQLVPFDGPGLETNRCNLLLGLIVRQGQGPKKDFLPVDINETARIIPESKPQSVPMQDIRAVKQEEKRYLTSLAPALAKEDKLLNTTEDADEPVTESFEETAAIEEGNNQESNKPLRFLPGVLVGWGGELPPLPDFGAKPKPAVSRDPRTQPVTPGTSTKSPTATPHRFVIKKKAVQVQPGLSSPTGASSANIPVVKDAVALNQGASVSLTDKPYATALNQGAPVSLKEKTDAAALNQGASVSLTDKPDATVQNQGASVSLTDKPDATAQNQGASVSLTDKPDATVQNQGASVSLTDKPDATVQNQGASVSLKEKTDATALNQGASVSLKEKTDAAALNQGASVSLQEKTDAAALNQGASVSLKEKTDAAALNQGASVSLKEKTDAAALNQGASVSLKEKTDAAALNQGASVSLKDKPPDVSTEAFLASLSPAQGGTEATGGTMSKKGEVSLPPETEKSSPDGSSMVLSKPQAASDETNSWKLPIAISGILKKCSAYSNVTEEKKTEVVPEPTGNNPAPMVPQSVPVVPEATGNNPAPFVPQPVPVLTSIRLDPAVASQQEEPQSNLSSSHTESESPSISQANISPAVAPTTFAPSAQQPQAVPYTATRTKTTDFQYESAMAPVVPTFSSAALFPAQQPQVPGSSVYPCGLPPNVIPLLQDQNHAPPWAPGGTMPHHAPPGPLLSYTDSYAPPSSAKDYKRLSDEYSDPWERPRHPEDPRRHRHHSESRHGKKSRHHDRERAKKHERSHEDKYRDGSRHSEDRHGERRKERHHSDEYRSKEKDRHRHRRDSDYENGRRNSKDS